jgi:hypothetical protein
LPAAWPGRIVERETVHPSLYERRDWTPPLDPPYAPANLRACDGALAPVPAGG